MAPAEFRHPELSDGEVLIGNFDEDTLHYVNWQTTRRGQLAYTRCGEPVVPHPDLPVLFPVFAQRTELEEAGIPIDGAFNVTLVN